MILRKLRLENVRSHARSEIEFEEGFNCVVGGVGAGKSSLLYALHFALFGEPLHRSYDYILREGKTTGKISLEFEHAGKTYKIKRMIRRERDKISQDMSELLLCQDDEKLAWGKAAAVQAQLRELIGLDKRIFEEFIWIQQEKMKELLLQAPRDRQRILDEVFGLSEFQRAWEKLLTYQRIYENRMNDLGSDRDVLGIADLKRQRSELSTNIMNLQIELETLKVDSEEAEKRFKDADARLKELEVEEKRITELGREKASLEASIAETRGNLERARVRLANAAQEINKIEELLQRLSERETEALSRLTSLGIPPTTAEDLKKLAEKLNAQLLDLRRQATELQTVENKSQTTLQTLQNNSLCPVCRRALDSTYKEQLSEELRQEIHGSGQQISLLNQELYKLNTQYSTVLVVKDEINDLRIRAMSNRENLEAAQSREADLKAEVEEKEVLLRKLTPELQAVEGEMAAFNVEELKLAREAKDEALRDHLEYKGRAQSQERSITEKSKLLESLEERLENAEEKLRRREKTEKVVSLVRDLRDIYRDVTPSLREMYIEGLRDAVQLELDALMTASGRSFYLDVDSEYTPVITEESGYVRDINFVSGGERTWVALAYRVGLGQLVTEARTGQSLDLLILDEPTESLGSEDGSIEALATAISNLKTVSQIIIVTHSAELAEKATAKIRIKKEGGVSKVEKV